MSHTYSKIIAHAVFSTKERRPLIEDVWRDRLFRYIAGTLRELGAHLIRGGGVADHVHLLMELKQTHAPADVLRAVKANSSKFLHDERLCPDFAWQTGYGIFSVSRSQEGSVVAYIDNQAEHHGRRSFKEEFIGLLERHGIDYDERYVWD